MKKFINSRFGLIVLIIGGLVLIFSFQKIGAIQPIEDGANYIFAPIQNFFRNTSIKVKNLFVYFEDFNELKTQNKAMGEEVADLISENFKLKKEIEDSKVINEQNEFALKHNFEHIPSKILGRSADEFQQVIIINIGSKDGIKQGYPVIANKGFLIGKVIETNRFTSKVLLLNDNHSSVGSIVQNNERSQGIVSGQHGITLKMELIPQDHIIKKDQLVVTSGFEKYIPADLIIGKITEIYKIDGELFQQATIEPIIDYRDLRIVSIILLEND